jgi:hypothetical protein
VKAAAAAAAVVKARKTVRAAAMIITAKTIAETTPNPLQRQVSSITLV